MKQSQYQTKAKKLDKQGILLILTAGLVLLILKNVKYTYAELTQTNSSFPQNELIKLYISL